jgi:ribosomal protein L37AE/L43A
MLTITHRERHDCPTCRGTRLVMIGRTSAQVALRCLRCGSWFAIEPDQRQTVTGDTDRLALASAHS